MSLCGTVSWRMFLSQSRLGKKRREKKERERTCCKAALKAKGGESSSRNNNNNACVQTARKESGGFACLLACLHQDDGVTSTNISLLSF